MLKFNSLQSSRCHYCHHDMLLPSHSHPPLQPDLPTDKLDGWSDDHKRLLAELESFLSRVRSDGLPSADSEPIYAGRSLAEIFDLLDRLSLLIHTLTDQLHQSTTESRDLTSDLKISQSNLVLAQSTVESLEQALQYFRRQRSESSITSEPQPSGGRLRMFNFGKRAKEQTPTSSLLSPAPSHQPPSPSPSSAASASSFFFFSSSSSPSSSTTASSESSSSSLQAELEKTRSAIGTLQAEHAALQASHAQLATQKAQLEAEIEGMSVALFEEANKMVRDERMRAHQLEGELDKLRTRASSPPQPSLAEIAEREEGEEEEKDNEEDEEGAGWAVERQVRSVERSGAAGEPCTRLKPLLLPNAISPKCASPNSPFTSTTIRRQSLRSPPTTSAVLVGPTTQRAPRLSQPPPASRRGATGELRMIRRLSTSTTCFGSDLPGQQHCSSSSVPSSRSESRTSFNGSSMSNQSRRTSIVYSKTAMITNECFISSPLMMTQEQDGGTGLPGVMGGEQVKMINNRGLPSGSEDQEQGHHNPSSLLETNAELDLDRLLASIVDCAESLGIQDELIGIF